jgi:hypothetical protein
MNFILSPFIIINVGRYRALVIDHCSESYQKIPLSALHVLRKFEKPVSERKVLDSFDVAQHHVLIDYFDFFKKKGWLINSKSVTNFLPPSFQNRKPTKRTKNLYLPLSLLNNYSCASMFNFRKEIGAECLVIIPDSSTDKNTNRLIDGNVYTQIAVVALEENHIHHMRHLREKLNENFQYYIHEHLARNLNIHESNFVYQIYTEHRVEKESDFSTKLDSLLNNFHYSPGVFSVYIDKNLDVFPHPLEKEWYICNLNELSSLRDLSRNEKYLAYYNNPRQTIDVCSECEFNLCCMLSIRSRAESLNLKSKPTNCKYDIANGVFVE